MIHELTHHILLIILGTSLPVPSWVIPSIINTIPPHYLAMDNFSQHKKDGDIWCSTPFYSGPQGYKMCLKVYANGCGDGAGTHVTVFIQIIQGEYDDTLTWPYTGTVTYEIINWKDDRDHIKQIVDFSEESTIAAGCGSKPTVKNSNPGSGHNTLSHNKLYGSISQYVNNDILCIRVSSITV